MNSTDILRLHAQVIITESIYDSQVLRPSNVRNEEDFEAFLHSKRCPICLGIPRVPAAITVLGCGHEGCMGCLAKFTRCPVGRCASYTSKDLLHYECWPHRAKASFKHNLLVKCAVCNEFKSGTLDQLIHHENTQCPKRIVCCPKEQCATKGTPEEIVTHYLECEADKTDAMDDEVTMSHVAKWSKEVNFNHSNRLSQDDYVETPRGQSYYTCRTRLFRTLFLE